MNLAVLVPVKAFSMAKGRLSGVLTPGERQRLARWLADGVIAAASAVPVFVVCDDEEVRDWATERGASALWTAELGLNGAVDDGVAAITDRGFEHVIVSHADLPLPGRLLEVARAGTATFVPDPNGDGTNLMSFPLRPAGAIAAAYGPGSFVRHRDAATNAGLAVEVRVDVELSLDLDTPTDLTHPLLREVLPTWLPTIPVNPFTHQRTPLPQ